MTREAVSRRRPLPTTPLLCSKGAPTTEWSLGALPSALDTSIKLRKIGAGLRMPPSSTLVRIDVCASGSRNTGLPAWESRPKLEDQSSNYDKSKPNQSRDFSEQADTIFGTSVIFSFRKILAVQPSPTYYARIAEIYLSLSNLHLLYTMYRLPRPTLKPPMLCKHRKRPRIYWCGCKPRGAVM